MELIFNFKSKLNTFISSECGRIITFALIGILAFLFVYGPRTLDVTNTEWLMNGKDPTLHFLGWEFFRNDPWAFPLGKISSYGYPFGSSTSSTDSITMLAILFKLINPILPQKFQYFGWWSLFCFAMQGIFGGLLLSRFARERASKNSLWIFIGTIFFTLSPIIVRTSLSALCGHWIILLSLYLYFKAKDTKISIFSWIMVNVLAVLIQPYFTFMTLMIYIGYEIDDVRAHAQLKNKKLLPNIKRFIAVIFALVLCGWMIGLFDMGASSTSRNQFGYYSMNLNALFNPMGWSSFLRELPTATKGQIAGLNYLGLGMIVILAVSIGVFIYERCKSNRGIFQWAKIQNWLGVLFIIISLFVFSLSNKITFFDLDILEYHLPVKIMDLCAIFRSSGRMFWPVFYLIYLFAFRMLFQPLNNKHTQRIVTVFLAAMLIVQIADIANSPSLKTKLSLRLKAVTYQSSLQSNFWNDAAQKYRHIIFLPPRFDNYELFSFYAVKNKMTINTGYFARIDWAKIFNYSNQRIDDIRKGRLDKNNLYIVKDPILFDELAYIVNTKHIGYSYKVDNFYVLGTYLYSEEIRKSKITPVSQ